MVDDTSPLRWVLASSGTVGSSKHSAGALRPCDNGVECFGPRDRGQLSRRYELDGVEALVDSPLDVGGESVEVVRFDPSVGAHAIPDRSP